MMRLMSHLRRLVLSGRPFFVACRLSRHRHLLGKMLALADPAVAGRTSVWRVSDFQFRISIFQFPVASSTQALGLNLLGAELSCRRWPKTFQHGLLTAPSLARLLTSEPRPCYPYSY